MSIRINTSSLIASDVYNSLQEFL